VGVGVEKYDACAASSDKLYKLTGQYALTDAKMPRKASRSFIIIMVGAVGVYVGLFVRCRLSPVFTQSSKAVEPPLL
jgi:hypothetical protein